ncbi:1-deoxy-D-xylulose-5-phosphate reductoisomerase [Guggenheimella bovis]
MKKIALLGASGSIGKQTLDCIRTQSEFSLTLVSVHKNLTFLEKIVHEFHPKTLLVTDDEAYKIAKKTFPNVYSKSDLEEVLKESDADILLNAIVGAAGLMATYVWLREGRKLALANKESLVSAGEIVNDLLKTHGGTIYPVDSEHSAIYKLLRGKDPEEIESLVITASGGAFRDKTCEEIKHLKAKDALKHPNWAMGQKITIDSATLVNKGLEVIEAHYLFKMPLEKIEVVMQRESVIHSLVRCKDGSLLAELAPHDMRNPILYALHEGKHRPNHLEKLDLTKLTLHFEPIDETRFHGLRLARYALKEKGSMPLVLNLSNEIFVERYLKGEIGFYDITEGIEKAMLSHKKIEKPTIEDLFQIEKEEKERICAL